MSDLRRSLLSRRQLLQASAGAASLFIGWNDLAKAAAGAITARPYFLYGLPPSGESSGVALGALSGAYGATAAPSSGIVATGLAEAPLPSPDGTSLTLTHIVQDGDAVSLSLSMASMRTGSISPPAFLTLPEATGDGYVLVTMTFTPDSQTLVIVLSISVPSNWRTVTKMVTPGKPPVPVRVADWVAHHELVYYDVGTGSFIGPLSLNNQGVLPRCSVVATQTDVYLWTVADAALQPLTKGAPRPVPVFSSYAVGTDRPNFAVPGPQPWPVSSEPVATAEDGHVYRFVYGNAVERYSMLDGTSTQTPVSELQLISAQPTTAQMFILPSGDLLLADATLGRAVVVSPQLPANAKRVIDFPISAYPTGARNKVALSTAGDVLYVPGSVQSGGVAAYDVETGRLVSAYADGEPYASVQLTANAGLVAVAAEANAILFLTDTLVPTGTATTSGTVGQVF